MGNHPLQGMAGREQFVLRAGRDDFVNQGINRRILYAREIA